MGVEPSRSSRHTGINVVSQVTQITKGMTHKAIVDLLRDNLNKGHISTDDMRYYLLELLNETNRKGNDTAYMDFIARLTMGIHTAPPETIDLTIDSTATKKRKDRDDDCARCLSVARDEEIYHHIGTQVVHYKSKLELLEAFDRTGLREMCDKREIPYRSKHSHNDLARKIMEWQEERSKWREIF